MMGKIYGSKDLLIEEAKLLRSYLHKRLWIKNRLAHLGKKRGFLKYNYSLRKYRSVNTFII